MRIGTASHLVCKAGRRMSWRAFEVPEGRWGKPHKGWGGEGDAGRL